MIPEGWSKVTPSEVITLFGGFAFKSADAQSSGAKWLKIANVSIGKITWDADSYLPESYLDKHPDYVLQQGDIVVALTRPTLGNQLKIAQLKADTDKSLLNQRVAKIITTNSCHQDFAYQLLRSDEIAARINSSLLGTDPPNLSVSVLKQFEILLPQLEEQKAIAATLSKWDEAIEKTEALIAAKEKRKKALMQQLLTGKKRFKEFEGAKWKEVALGDLFLPITDQVGEKKLTPYSISAGIGFVSQEKKWGKSIAGKQYEKYTHLRTHEFAYNKGNSKQYPCGCAYLLKSEADISVPNVFISFKAKNDNVCPYFYEQFFIADYHARELKRYISSGARSDGLLNLSKTDFFKIKVPCPSLKEQESIAAVLCSADNELVRLKRKQAKLALQKKALMQQLLTGKVRTKAA